MPNQFSYYLIVVQLYSIHENSHSLSFSRRHRCAGVKVSVLRWVFCVIWLFSYMKGLCDKTRPHTHRRVSKCGFFYVLWPFRRGFGLWWQSVSFVASRIRPLFAGGLLVIAFSPCFWLASVASGWVGMLSSAPQPFFCILIWTEISDTPAPLPLSIMVDPQEGHQWETVQKWEPPPPFLWYLLIASQQCHVWNNYTLCT